jgi:L-iditol 2-dehydrogenase
MRPKLRLVWIVALRRLGQRVSLMQAALLYDKQDLRLEELPTPQIGDGEILLRTASASVCGTDIRMLQHGHAFATPDHPLVIGHEMAGTIEHIGAGVSGLQRGQRVCVAPNYNPVTSRLVAAGEGHLDPGYRALGIHEHGAFAEFVRIPRDAVQQGNVFPLPEHVSFAAAALVEPLACVYNAYEKARTGPGDVVLIFGAGPIGLMHAKISRMAGAAKVILTDVNESRLALARSLDPGWITIAGDPGAELTQLTDGAGADVIITACPVPAVQTRAIELAAVNGRVIFFGGLPKGKSVVPLDTNLIHYRQVLVTGTTRQSLRHFQKTLELVADRKIEVEDLITSTHTLAEVGLAITRAASGTGLKARIAFEA